jgi:hypothetical protein
MHTWKFLEYLSPLVAELVYNREKSHFIHTSAAGGQHSRTQSERVGLNLGQCNLQRNADAAAAQKVVSGVRVISSDADQAIRQKSLGSKPVVATFRSYHQDIVAHHLGVSCTSLFRQVQHRDFMSHAFDGHISRDTQYIQYVYTQYTQYVSCLH